MEVFLKILGVSFVLVSAFLNGVFFAKSKLGGMVGECMAIQLGIISFVTYAYILKLVIVSIMKSAAGL